MHVCTAFMPQPTFFQDPSVRGVTLAGIAVAVVALLAWWRRG